MAAKLVDFYAHIESDVKTSSLHPIDMSALSEVELNIESLRKNRQIKVVRTKKASVVFANIRKDYNR